MDDKLSFIPKKTFTTPLYRERGMGIFSSLSFLLLVISLIVWGGLLVYRNNLKNNVEVMQDSLKKANAAFEIPLINEVISTTDSIESAKKLLASHKSMVPVLTFLEDYTSKDVYYKNMKYTLTDSGYQEIVLDGVAKSYGVLAYQVDAFNQLRRNKKLKNVAFSGIGAGDKGQINFNVKLIDPSI